jgi:hypothetical protein
MDCPKRTLWFSQRREGSGTAQGDPGRLLSRPTSIMQLNEHLERAGARSLRAIAEALNAHGVPTARGGRWQAMTVSNVLARA